LDAAPGPEASPAGTAIAERFIIAAHFRGLSGIEMRRWALATRRAGWTCVSVVTRIASQP
jgi:hypothetical protein